MKKLIEVLGEIIPSGIHPSLPNQAAPLWADGRNVVFEELAVTPGPGQAALFGKIAAEKIMGIFEIEDSPARFIYWGDKLSLYKGTQGLFAPTNVTRVSDGGVYTGTDTDQWRFSNLGLDIVATNNVDEVQIKLAAASKFVNFSDEADLPDTFRCRILKNTEAFMVAFNTDNDDTEIRWCSEDDILNWIPEAANQARDIQMRNLGSGIQCVQNLGPGWGIFGRAQLHFIQFVGPPFFFETQHLLDGIGALGPYSVTPVARRLYGAGPDGCFETDGATYTYITTPSMHKFMYVDEGTSIAKDFEELTVAWVDLEESLIYFSYHTSVNSGITTSYDYERRVWSIHEFWRTAASSAGIFDNPTVGSPNGDIVEQGVQAIASIDDPVPVTMLHRSHFVSGYGELGYGECGYGSDSFEPGPLELDEE